MPKVTATVVATTSTSALPPSVPDSTTSTDAERPNAAPYPAGPTRVSFEFGGRQRTFIVYVPKGLSVDAAAPLVFQIHGGKGTGAETDGLTKLNVLADRDGFITVAPDGVEKNWNDGRVDNRQGTAFTENIDDVGFLVTVLDEISTHNRVDQRRVYAMGISNGAMMSGRLACERPDRFVAVGLIAGTGPADLANLCTSKAPVSIVAFNGTADPLIDYDGDASVHPELGKRLSVDRFADYWVQRNGCSEPVVDQPTETISRRTWTCGATDVVFHRVAGGGHTWPGSRQYLPKFIVGSTDGSMDATAVMWDFFKAHPRAS
jgi:polyhydroxybutyrate depolymerase